MNRPGRISSLEAYPVAGGRAYYAGRTCIADVNYRGCGQWEVRPRTGAKADRPAGYRVCVGIAAAEHYALVIANEALEAGYLDGRYFDRPEHEAA